MPFDGRAEDWQDGPQCRRCGEPIAEGQPRTEMHFQHDPDGELGLSGPYHGECARPYWDTISPLLKNLGWSSF
jgi:hypothetical protein